MAARTVLVIDDDPEIVHALAALLGSKGYRVVTASDGEAGITAVERDSPDLVIVDMMMPKKSGIAVLQKLKSRTGSSPKVIMMTANEGSRHRAYAEMLGADDYLFKPFSLDTLLASVSRLCPTDRRP